MLQNIYLYSIHFTSVAKEINDYFLTQAINHFAFLLPTYMDFFKNFAQNRIENRNKFATMKSLKNNLIKVCLHYLNFGSAYASPLNNSSPKARNSRIGYPKQTLHQIRHSQPSSPIDKIIHSSRVVIFGQKPGVNLKIKCIALKKRRQYNFERRKLRRENV